MGALKNQMIDHMRARGYSDKTIKLYTQCVGAYARHCAASPLSANGAQAEGFFLRLREEGRSEATVRAHYWALKFFYAMHGVEGRLPRMAFRGLRGRLPEVLSQAEVRALLDACGSLRFRTLFALIYSAGLRISEATNLRVDDLDFERGQIRVRRGKGGKDRVTILSTAAASLVRTYLQVYGPESHLFYRRGDTSRRMSIDTIQAAFRRLAAESGLPAGVHVHTLRHCFATHLLENGTNLFYIMQLMGHASIQTTLLYLRMRAPRDLGIVSPLDAPEPRGPSAFRTGARRAAQGQLMLESALPAAV